MDCGIVLVLLNLKKLMPEIQQLIHIVRLRVVSRQLDLRSHLLPFR